VAVSKPPGLSFHSDASGVPGLVAVLREQLPGLLSDYCNNNISSSTSITSHSGAVGGGGGLRSRAALLDAPAASAVSSSTVSSSLSIDRLWPVHRLDTITSG